MHIPDSCPSFSQVGFSSELAYLYERLPMILIITILASVVHSWGKMGGDTSLPALSYRRFKQLAAYQFFTLGFWLLLQTLQGALHWRLFLSLYFLAYVALLPNVLTFFLLIFHWGAFQRVESPFFRDEKRRMALLCVMSGFIYSIFLYDLLRFGLLPSGVANSSLVQLVFLNYCVLQAYWTIVWQMGGKKTNRLLQRYQNLRITVI